MLGSKKSGSTKARLTRSITIRHFKAETEGKSIEKLFRFVANTRKRPQETLFQKILFLKSSFSKKCFRWNIAIYTMAH